MRSLLAISFLPLVLGDIIMSEMMTLNRRFVPSLESRQSGCRSDEEVCGSHCIPQLYTCCPDREGGCPVGEVCSLGDNGAYGCCPIGETCSGDGGVDVIDEDDDTSGSGSSSDDTGDDDSDTGGSSSGSGSSSDSSPGSGSSGIVSSAPRGASADITMLGAAAIMAYILR